MKLSSFAGLKLLLDLPEDFVKFTPALEFSFSSEEKFTTMCVEEVVTSLCSYAAEIGSQEDLVFKSVTFESANENRIIATECITGLSVKSILTIIVRSRENVYFGNIFTVDRTASGTSFLIAETDYKDQILEPITPLISEKDQEFLVLENFRRYLARALDEVLA